MNWITTIKQFTIKLSLMFWWLVYQYLIWNLRLWHRCTNVSWECSVSPQAKPDRIYVDKTAWDIKQYRHHILWRCKTNCSVPIWIYLYVTYRFGSVYLPTRGHACNHMSYTEVSFRQQHLIGLHAMLYLLWLDVWEHWGSRAIWKSLYNVRHCPLVTWVRQSYLKEPFKPNGPNQHFYRNCNDENTD